MATKKKAASKKPAPKTPKRDHGDAIRDRFLFAMDSIISKKPGSTIRTQRDFGISIGAASTLNKVSSQLYKRHPSLHMLSEVCSKHGVNGEWLLTGKGQMFRENTMTVDIPSIAARLAAMENEVALLKQKK